MASWSSVDQSYMNGLKSDSEDSESGVEGNNRGRLRSDSGYSSAPLSPVKSSSNEVQLTSEENFWLNRTAEDLTQLLFGLGMVDSVQECMAKLTATEEEVPKMIDCRWESDPNRFDNVVMLRVNKPKGKKSKPITPYCQFCRNNNESDINNWSSHICRDEYDRVVCPVLRKYKCPYCKATGDKAHTIRYCPIKKEAELKELEEHFNKCH